MFDRYVLYGAYRKVSYRQEGVISAGDDIRKERVNRDTFYGAIGTVISAGCSIFIGFPISNWTTSSQVCSLPEINNINTTDIFVNLLENTTFKEDDKAWTGTVIKYTKFAAFIVLLDMLKIEKNGNQYTSELLRKSWYEYQEICLKEGRFVLFNRHTIGNAAKDNEVFWTPIFRSHTVVSGIISITELNGVVNMLIQICFSKEEYDRLQSTYCDISCICRSGRTCGYHYPDISSCCYQLIRFYKEQLKQVNEKLPGTEFSSYTGIKDTNEEVNSLGYKELSDNSQQNNETGLKASQDEVDNQGYLISEQHYHIIPEVEVHYVEANAAESYEDEEHIDKDGYLEPVTK
ncbi:unnamed protein product [Mytilus coruscus]|uniref:Uncharacterized protein n=1 Tax=Mytilus coruscus TaxID=42192 RepID=A0A6J8DII2_MYTCO|nr:unnamed protein product [Mytilus coruscus]